jgi:hypothetical protein
VHRTRGLDLQCRETSALFVIEQVRDLARGRADTSPPSSCKGCSPRRLPRGKRCRRGRSQAVPRGRAARSPGRTDLLHRGRVRRSGALTRSSGRASGCKQEHTSFPIRCTAEPLDLRSPRCTPVTVRVPPAPVDDRLSVPPSLDRFPDVLQPLLDRLARSAASRKRRTPPSQVSRRRDPVNLHAPF